MQISSKISVLSIIISLVSSSLIGAAAYLISRQKLEQQLSSNFADRLSLINYKLESELNGLTVKSKAWSSHWVMTEIPSGDEELNLSAFITEIAKANQIVKDVYVVNLEKEIVAATKVAAYDWESTKINQVLKEFEFELVRTKEQALTKLSGKNKSFISLPVRDLTTESKPILGVLIININFEFLKALVASINNNKADLNKVNAYLAVNGKSIFSILESTDLTFEDIAQASKGKEGSFARYRVKDTSVVISQKNVATALPGFNSKVSMTLLQTESIAFESVNELTKLIASVAVLILIILLPIAIIFSRTLGRPIANLKNLVNEIIDSGDISRRTNITTKDETGSLSKAFNELLAKIEQHQSELKHYNLELENMVEERALQIRTILDNIRSGFLLIDKDNKVLEGFTKSCHDLFRKKVEPGRLLTDILELNERDAEQFNCFLNQVFDCFGPPEISLSHLPKRVKIGPKVLSLYGSLVRGSNSEIASVLFSIDDVSKLAEIEQRNIHNDTLINILSQKEFFIQFVSDTNEMILSAIQNVKNQQMVRNLLHTVKGNSASFGLKEVANTVHQVEELGYIGEKDIRKIEAIFFAFLNQNESFLQLDTNRKKISIQYEHWKILKEEIASSTSNIEKELLSWITIAEYKPIAQLVGPIDENIKKIATQLNKSVSVRVSGLDALVDERRYRKVFSSLVHIARNSIDHGIEVQEERGDKPKKGNITIDFKLDEKGLTFTFEDDGKGINTEKLKEKALANGLHSESEIGKLSDDEALQLIFASGLSTRDEVSLSSGRGAGMNAVKSEVEEAGGSIKVESELGKGTKFTFFFPNEPLVESREFLKQASSL